MFKVTEARHLADNMLYMDIEAPRIAKHCLPGQFVITRS